MPLPPQEGPIEGITLELGEGISLNIPIKRRMSMMDFLKIAEKVKALETLSRGEPEEYGEEYHHY
ncbi:hypothetical protein JXB02_04220 [Candidatus Woesearchaeota archaeon]|nr:hypothetical protein [Candidatus Woesearchaeota archaeon]